MVLLMAAILLRTGRQDIHQLLDAIGQVDIEEIDETMEENLDEEDEEEGGWQ